MRIPNLIATVARVVLWVSIPFVLLVSPLFLFASNIFIRHEYAQQGFPASERFNTQERLRLSGTILDYIRGRASREDMASMRTDSGEVAMLPEEVQHIADVKGVMEGFFRGHTLALILALLAALALWFSPQRARLGVTLQQGIWISLGLIALVVIASFINFDVFFTNFHRLFFTEGTWVFYVEDTLIQLYPLPLWVDAVWKIGVVVVAEMAALYLAARVLHRVGQ